jgi:ubiquinone biosynthesis monooxygenase Coq7
VETVIEGHYGKQVEELRLMGETKLADQFAQFQAEEVEHKDLAVDEGARDAVGYPILSAAITVGCHTAIAVSERV